MGWCDWPIRTGSSPASRMIQRWRTQTSRRASSGAQNGGGGPFAPAVALSPHCGKKKGRQPLSGDSAAPNPGLLLCRREEPHTSDTYGRLASMPKWGAGDAGSASTGTLFHCTRRNSKMAEALQSGLALAGGASGAATLPFRGEPAPGRPPGRPQVAARSAAPTLGPRAACTGDPRSRPSLGGRRNEQKRSLSQAPANRRGGGAAQYRLRSNLSNSSPGCSRCPVWQAS